MDPLIDVRNLIDVPAQISSVQPEAASTEFAPANGPSEEYLAHNQTALVERWLQKLKSTSNRARQRLRATNPLFITDSRRGQSK